MKIIEKSPAILAYVCESCNTEYTTEVEALECEAKHQKAIGLTASTFNNEESVYPDVVDVRMNDTTIQTYSLAPLVPEDVVNSETDKSGKTTLALVTKYVVEVNKNSNDSDGNVYSTPINNAKVELIIDESIGQKKLHVTIPDSEEILDSSTGRVDNICVRVYDENDNIIANPFDTIIVGEVKRIIPNDCFGNAAHEE